MHEVSFKLRHECPYRTLSERFPDVTIREWHRHDCQVLEISTADTPGEELVDAIETIGTVLQTNTSGDDAYVLARSCRCPIEGSIIERFQKHNCVYIPPTVYRRGWEHFTVVGFEEEDVHALLGELDESREIDLLSKTSVERRQLPHSALFSLHRLFAGLTDRQLDALRLALDNGYYDQPRGASTSELAEETTVARATYEEHLRKAENKLLTNVEQFVRLLTETESTDGLRAPSTQYRTPAESD